MKSVMISEVNWNSEKTQNYEIMSRYTNFDKLSHNSEIYNSKLWDKKLKLWNTLIIMRLLKLWDKTFIKCCHNSEIVKL